jgi:hypothetical protein
MQLRKIASLALVVVFALCAFASASALAAEPNVVLLSGETFPVKFEGTSGKGVLETIKGTTIKCSSGSSTGEITAAKTGTATITFKGCEALSQKCETTGAKEKGEIVTSGTTLLVYDNIKTGELGVADLLTVNETTIKCTALVSIKVKGTILLLIKKINEEGTKFELVVKQTSGKPEDKNYWTSTTGTEQHPLLLSSINGGAFEESGDESAENKITTAKMVTFEG